MCAEQTALAGFLLESPGQKTHESAASRIYSQLIKLAFVLLLGKQPVSINMHCRTLPHGQTNMHLYCDCSVKETRQRGKKEEAEKPSRETGDN